MLQTGLQTIIYPEKTFFASKLFLQPILLKRVKNSTRIIYSTAIAHAPASRYRLPVTVVAAQIADALYSSAEPTDREAETATPDWSRSQLQHVRVWVTEAGLIQFEIGDRAIAAWLDHLTRRPIQFQNYTDRQSFTADLSADPLLAGRLFAVQHAHARCCSLLQLAHAAKLITLEQPHPQEPLTWQLTHPTPLPWLTPDGQLLLHSATDCHLTSCLLTALDSFSIPTAQPTPEKSFKLAEAVGQAFTAFHAAHPLLENSFNQNNTLRVAYLGYLFVTQRVLRLLLVDVLGVAAPFEL